MGALIDQVMSEASLYDRAMAALALKQAEGSPEEAVFILRAFRSTLPRRHYTTVIESESMTIERRISAAFKDIPGGQVLGASKDYTHRLVDFDLSEESPTSAGAWLSAYREALPKEPVSPGLLSVPKVLDYLRNEGLMREVDDDNSPPDDVTKMPLEFPTSRSARLQILTRGQTGAVTALAYASLRGYGPLLHPNVAELRVGALPVAVPDPTDGSNEEDAYYIGSIQVTEVESVVPVTVRQPGGDSRIRLDIGYGICFGRNETKAVAMSLLDQCLEQPDTHSPVHDEEFVLLHIDSVEATGFISHLKLPHYVTFQSELDAVRQAGKESKENGDAQ